MWAERPPALWPLVDLSAAQKADHVAVLWFVAEAEDVAVTAMKAYIREEDLMQSVLYQEIFADGKLEGKLEGERQTVFDLCEVLGITLTPAQTARIQELDLDQLTTLRTHLKRDRAWIDL